MNNIASQSWVKGLLNKLHIGKYSTDEIRVGTWIDGKPVYRCVVTFTPTGLSGMATFNIANVENITKKETLLKYYDSNFSCYSIINVAYMGTPSGWMMNIGDCFIYDTKLVQKYIFGSSWTASLAKQTTLTMIFEYTKKTTN